ncbi:electron transfer flavoprotein subunit alpha/FixB family protein [Bradyrhizobium prioriisuperbiae]|uniref:electron transfer flavoprotein subunit alpha/FixB family protein n=1 Tax=Bradyrhizobium prioriisuperbiae TaxID=2854389 RepID=UPI0028E7CED4|nr:electron transfer flavoprotein subunit alpha/FixB family protein [Bradyrhizobium prioritasuperba]
MSNLERCDPRTRVIWRTGPDNRLRGVLRKAKQVGKRIVEPLMASRMRRPNGPTVVAIIESAGGRIGEIDRQLLGAARHLADQHAGGVLVPAWADTGSDALAASGADYVVRVDYPVDGCEREAMSQALIAIDNRYAPMRLMFCDAIGRSGDVGRRFTARSRATTTTHRPDDGAVGNGAAPEARVVFFQDEGFAPCAPGAGVALERILIDGTITRYTGTTERDQLDLVLPEASFILSAGTGVEDWHTFTALARALSATIGATRAICDTGLLPRDRQIGASGQIVSPACYIALGISGAPQHVQGLRDCEQVIAVNTDLHAAMIKRADLAIIADVQKVMPALLDALRPRK